ncbi:LOW QUALITY PROTEIN: hypothetical protein U9M48_029025 [Paspalum notatum var. saurae]|uniref:Uncharacterized protein n=1 Tax=Paspalum notatum var. saurae TaxID=547442 RepID=A0AAQ3X134_PASNO
MVPNLGHHGKKILLSLSLVPLLDALASLLRFEESFHRIRFDLRSAHGPSRLVAAWVHFKTTLLHLNPDPNPIIQTRSPLRIRFLASMYPSSYQTELLDVFPKRCSVIRDGSTSSSDRRRLRWTASITARPPAWMQICSKAVRKSGLYLSAVQHLACHRWEQKPQLLGEWQHKRPNCPDVGLQLIVRTVCISLNRDLDDLDVENSAAAPPIRNRTFGSSIEQFLPKWSETISVHTTSACDIRGASCKSLFATSTEISPALHPIPDMWMLLMSPRSLYLFTIMSAKDGTGLKAAQFVMTMSIASGLMQVLANKSSIDEKMTCSASLRAPPRVRHGGMYWAPEGRAKLCGFQQEDGCKKHSNSDNEIVHDKLEEQERAVIAPLLLKLLQERLLFQTLLLMILAGSAHL